MRRATRSANTPDMGATDFVIQSLNGKPVGNKFLTVKRALGPPIGPFETQLRPDAPPARPAAPGPFHGTRTVISQGLPDLRGCPRCFGGKSRAEISSELDVARASTRRSPFLQLGRSGRGSNRLSSAQHQPAGIHWGPARGPAAKEEPQQSLQARKRGGARQAPVCVCMSGSSAHIGQRSDQTGVPALFSGRHCSPIWYRSQHAWASTLLHRRLPSASQ